MKSLSKTHLGVLPTQELTHDHTVDHVLAHMLQRYGPLMSLEDVAEVLKRSPQGLRVSCYRNNPLAQMLNQAKVPLGRHVRYRTCDIAKFIESDHSNVSIVAKEPL